MMKKKSKKNGFFIKKDWTVSIIMIILIGSLSQFSLFAEPQIGNKMQVKQKKSGEGKEEAKEIAGLQAELKMARQELLILRKELANVLLQSDKNDLEYMRLQASIAGSIANGSKKSYSKDSMKVLRSLEKVRKTGKELVLCARDNLQFIKNILDQDKISDIDKARAEIRIDKLNKDVENFYVSIQERKQDELFRSCRVIDVNDKLQVVLLNVGITSGMRNGVILKDAEGTCRIRVVAIRPYLSAAVVTEGALADLSSGMVLYPGK